MADDKITTAARKLKAAQKKYEKLVRKSPHGMTEPDLRGHDKACRTALRAKRQAAAELAAAKTGAQVPRPEDAIETGGGR